VETDINWPDGMPCALREGHGTQHGTSFIRTTMASGRARQRRAFTSVPSAQRFQWLFTSAQCIVFEGWFRDVINDGAEWFNMNSRTPLGIVTPLVCRFTEMYSGPDLEGIDLWRISAELEVWERPLLPPVWSQFPEYVLGANIIDVAMNRKWPLAPTSI
jgi:hypothetical protein